MGGLVDLVDLRTPFKEVVLGIFKVNKEHVSRAVTARATDPLDS